MQGLVVQRQHFQIEFVGYCMHWNLPVWLRTRPYCYLPIFFFFMYSQPQSWPPDHVCILEKLIFFPPKKPSPPTPPLTLIPTSPPPHIHLFPVLICHHLLQPLLSTTSLGSSVRCASSFSIISPSTSESPNPNPFFSPPNPACFKRTECTPLRAHLFQQQYWMPRFPSSVWSQKQQGQIPFCMYRTYHQFLQVQDIRRGGSGMPSKETVHLVGGARCMEFKGHVWLGTTMEWSWAWLTLEGLGHHICEQGNVKAEKEPEREVSHEMEQERHVQQPQQAKLVTDIKSTMMFVNWWSKDCPHKGTRSRSLSSWFRQRAISWYYQFWAAQGLRLKDHLPIRYPCLRRWLWWLGVRWLIQCFNFIRWSIQQTSLWLLQSWPHHSRTEVWFYQTSV